MKNLKSIGPWSAMVVAVACFMMTGCVARRIAWSPDGAHAAIFAGDGLHLCGPDGALSETILVGDGMGQWFSDSRRLAVVSAITGQSWQDMQKILPPQECRRAEQGGKAILDALKAGRSFTDAYNNLDGFGEYEKSASVAYLLQKDGAREQAGSYWDELQQKQASVVQLRVGTLADGKLALGSPILSTLRKFSDIRVSPAGTLIAYTSEGDKDQEAELHVVPVDASAPPVLITKSAAYCPDWSPDGHFLLYIRAINEAAAGDQLCLGSLTRTAVQFTAGKIEIQTNSEDLAGLLFDVNSKVRCAPDGRIIFSAADVHLPCTTLDMPEQPQLFALDPERQTAVIPLIPRSVQDNLPAKPAYYEVSPDGKRIAIAADKGAVVILTLATGNLATVQAAGTDDTASAPDWRSADELCFVSTANGQPSQVSLWKNGVSKVLSTNWPAAARKGFLDP